jgi:DNA-binding response OmpR family regulator
VSIEILSVEDDDNLAYVISTALQRGGTKVTRAKDGLEGLRLAMKDDAPDLIILDVMLPDLSGFEVCQRLREAGVNIPVIFLTAADSVGDKVRGLTMGADDYLTKPFNPRELVARIKSILRRSTQTARSSRPQEAAMEHGQLRIDAGRREVTVSGRQVQLAPKEFDLLWELLDHRGLVLTRDQLLERVWGYTFAGDTRTVDVHVRQLRRKLGDDCPVATVWGVGYKVADDAAVT